MVESGNSAANVDFPIVTSYFVPKPSEPAACDVIGYWNAASVFCGVSPETKLLTAEAAGDTPDNDTHGVPVAPRAAAST